MDSSNDVHQYLGEILQRSFCPYVISIIYNRRLTGYFCLIARGLPPVKCKR